MDPRPIHFKSNIHELTVVFVICMAQFLTQGSITMSLSTMNIILDSFDSVETSQKVWFMGSFSLTVGTVILIGGKLGDLFGLKKIFIIGWFWCFIWCLIIGFSKYANTIIFFIICRAFQGIGFALLLPCGMGILGSCYSNGSRKNLAFGAVGASGPSGAAVGCLMAAVVGQLTNWAWEFWLLSIVCFIFGVISIWLIPESMNVTPESMNVTTKNDDDINDGIPNWKKFDYLGTALGLPGLILLSFVWSQGPIVGWSSAYIITLLIISIMLIIAFFIVELKYCSYPLLPPSIFNYKIGLVLTCVGLLWGSFGCFQYYYWNTILNLRHYTAIQGGLTYITFFVVGIAAAFICSFIIAKVKPSYIILAASIAFTCGCIMLSVMPIHQSYFKVSFGLMLILSWGMDLSFPAASIILSDCLPAHHQGMAGSLVSTVINYSISLFLGMASTVEARIYLKTNNVLSGYRAGTYFGIGIAALSTMLAIVFVITQHLSNDSSGTDAFVDNIDSESTEEKENDNQDPYTSSTSLTP